MNATAAARTAASPAVPTAASPTVTPTSEAAAAAAIAAACRSLMLPTIREQAGPLAQAAARERLTHQGYLAEVLTAECDDRDARRRIRRVKEAKFPRTKSLADFDTIAITELPAATVAQLATGAWSDAGKPVVPLGDSGTGKTHLGTAAAEQGRRVRYVTTVVLVNELAEAADAKQLSCVVACYGRLDLLCLDELAYVTLDARGPSCCSNSSPNARNGPRSPAPSNAPFNAWGAPFTDPRLAVAVVDRLTFNAHIINARTSSYRLRTTRAQKGAATT